MKPDFKVSEIVTDKEKLKKLMTLAMGTIPTQEEVDEQMEKFDKLVYNAFFGRKDK